MYCIVTTLVVLFFEIFFCINRDASIRSIDRLSRLSIREIKREHNLLLLLLLQYEFDFVFDNQLESINQSIEISKHYGTSHPHTHTKKTIIWFLDRKRTYNIIINDSMMMMIVCDTRHPRWLFFSYLVPIFKQQMESLVGSNPIQWIYKSDEKWKFQFFFSSIHLVMTTNGIFCCFCCCCEFNKF